MLTYQILETALGDMTACFADDALILLQFGDKEPPELSRAAAEAFPGQLPVRRSTPASDAVLSWLDAYAAGARKPFGLPIRLFGTPFQLRVWRQMHSIPFGQTVSYEELARLCDTSAVRAVGTAVGCNPLAVVIPCHRVIRKDGSIGRYSGGDGPETKRRLLEIEGAISPFSWEK